MYYLPAIAHANRQGLNLPLSRGRFCTIRKFNMVMAPIPILISNFEISAKIGGYAQNRNDEKLWVKNFFTSTTIASSLCPQSSYPKSMGRSVTRVDVWSAIANSDNYHLSGRLKFGSVTITLPSPKANSSCIAIARKIVFYKIKIPPAIAATVDLS